MTRRPKGSKRKSIKRESYDKVLVVCEGLKTEPNYFNEIKTMYQLSSLNIVIDGDCGSSPSLVVNHAKALATKEEKLGSPFDRIFCVMDKDNHPDYERALNQVKARKNAGFDSIVSVPSFEFWLLLHFEYTTRAYVSQRGNSVGHQVLKELKKKPGMANYGKGVKGVFKQLFTRLEQAKSNAQKVLKAAKSNETDNPSTNVHRLVEYLQHIRYKQ